MLVKCQVCKEKDEKETMRCVESGNKTIVRKYYHKECYKIYEDEREKRQIDANKWDELYQYIIKLHNLEVLDGRMIEKLQDLRNGSVKQGNIKIKKYKSGVEYDIILETYKQQENNIDWVMKNKHFDKKWNEFSYILGVVISKINDVIQDMIVKKKQEKKFETQIDKSKKYMTDLNENVFKKKEKQDELDISEFL